MISHYSDFFYRLCQSLPTTTTDGGGAARRRRRCWRRRRRASSSPSTAQSTATASLLPAWRASHPTTARRRLIRWPELKRSQ
ncbi:hypothetical protein PUN28_017356 [Cardiocondyla obscurior]|uniref:Uncharacterized protein n=1 Tax=Cardiocondyla obscurior TaxID=286306 RepID=A0AAW2ENJ8_9HYME